MKTNQITVASGIHDPELETKIQKKDKELKLLSEKNGKFFAEKNLPQPLGDNILDFIDEMKTGYEKLVSDMYRHLQPEVHGPQAQYDAEYLRKKDAELVEQIKQKENKNKNEAYELGNFDLNTMNTRMYISFLISIVIMAGEIMFNTKAFQVLGDSMLTAFIFSVAVSLAVTVLSHMATFIYKAVKTKMQRKLTVVISLTLVTIVFTALAFMRSTYLDHHDIQINPTYFVVFNLFLFIVSAGASYILLPTWKEIQSHKKQLKIYLKIEKRKMEILALQKEREQIQLTVLENTKLRTRLMSYATYCETTIHKMYSESVAIFKRTNRAFRSDNQMPDCFSEQIPELTVDSFSFSFIQSKPNTNEN